MTSDRAGEAHVMLVAAAGRRTVLVRRGALCLRTGLNGPAAQVRNSSAGPTNDVVSLERHEPAGEQPERHEAAGRGSVGVTQRSPRLRDFWQGRRSVIRGRLGESGCFDVLYGESRIHAADHAV